MQAPCLASCSCSMVPMAMAMASGTLQQQLVACGTRRQAWALLFLLPLAAAQQKPLRPSHAMINLTLFHVGPSDYHGLTDMNSGDVAGDAFFMLRAAGLPYLCSNSSGMSDRTFDCHDVEQHGADLVVSQYQIEADSRFSGYAECNVNATANGTYDCECRDRSGDDAALGLPRHRRKLQHHHHRDVPCNATVGRILVLNESSFASVPPTPSGPPSFLNSPYRFWYYNLAQKLPTGTWYSTLGKGECGNPASHGTCAWRILRRVKTVAKKCQEENVLSRVETIGAACFQGCPGKKPVARDTKCWTDCFYDTVIGPRSNSTAYPNGSAQGVDSELLTGAWLAAFRSSDPKHGGCPDLGGKSTRRVGAQRS
jgi:hypothetical protein